MGRKGDGWEGEGDSGSRVEKVDKAKGGLDLDICPGCPEFLVTPLLLSVVSSQTQRTHRVQRKHNACV